MGNGAKLVTAETVKEFSPVLAPGRGEELKGVNETPEVQMRALLIYAALKGDMTDKAAKTGAPNLREGLQFSREFFAPDEQGAPNHADHVANLVREFHDAHVKATGDNGLSVRDTVRKVLAIVAQGDLGQGDSGVRIERVKTRIGDDVTVRESDIASLWSHTPLASASIGGSARAAASSQGPEPSAPSATPPPQGASGVSMAPDESAEPARGTALARVDQWTTALGPVGKIKVETALGITVAAVTALARADWTGVEETTEGMVDLLKKMRGEGADPRAIVRLVTEGKASPGEIVHTHIAAERLDLVVPELVNPDEYSRERLEALDSDPSSLPLAVASAFMERFGIDDESSSLGDDSELAEAIEAVRERILDGLNEGELADETVQTLTTRVKGERLVRVGPALRAALEVSESLNLVALRDVLDHSGFFGALNDAVERIRSVDRDAGHGADEEDTGEEIERED